MIFRPSTVPSGIQTRRKCVATALGVCLLAGTSPAFAEPTERLAVPFGDAPVTYEPSAQALRVSAAGLADGRGRLTGQGVRARAVAERRAVHMLQQHVDVVLERKGVTPPTAERVHDAIEAAARVVGDRPLADGSLVVTLELPLSPLTAAWPPGEALWVH